MIRMLFFIGLGIMLGTAALLFSGIDQASVWGLPVGGTIMVISGVLIIISSAMKSAQSVSPEAIESARREGRIGQAFIESLTQTNTMINDQPVCDVVMTVQPQQALAYRATIRIIVPLSMIPAYQPGQVREVAFFGDAGTDIAFTGNSSGIPAGQHRPPPVDSSAGIRTLRPAKVTRNGSTAAPLIGMGRKGRGLRVVTYVLLVVLSAAATLFPHRAAVADTLEAIAQGYYLADLRTPGRMEHVSEALEKAAGHRLVNDVYLHRDQVRVSMPVTAGERATDDWYYSRAAVHHEGPALIQPDSEREQFSLDEVSWDAIWPVVEQAAAEYDYPDLDNVSISVQRSTISDVHSEDFIRNYGPIEIRFTLENAYESAFFLMDSRAENLTLTGTS